MTRKPKTMPGPPPSAAPYSSQTLDHVTETALTHPQINARHLPAAREVAREEVALLEYCIQRLEPGSEEHRGFSADLAWLRSLPGYAEQPDLWEAA